MLLWRTRKGGPNQEARSRAEQDAGMSTWIKRQEQRNNDRSGHKCARSLIYVTKLESKKNQWDDGKGI